MKVVKSGEAPWLDALQRGAYHQRRKELGGGERLSCSLWELAPGKKSFPMHAHQVTEEALFVVSGHALVRTPEGDTPVGPGDFVAFPPGGLAHQLVNDGTEPVTYLGLSSVMGVDIVDYPQSGKVSAAAGKYPHGKRFIFRKTDQVDYFEDDADA
jgi:uncharacterized cupin superfamily protein